MPAEGNLRMNSIKRSGQIIRVQVPVVLLIVQAHYLLNEGCIADWFGHTRSEEHTSELQSRRDLVCRLLLEKKKITTRRRRNLRHAQAFKHLAAATSRQAEKSNEEGALHAQTVQQALRRYIIPLSTNSSAPL